MKFTSSITILCHCPFNLKKQTLKTFYKYKKGQIKYSILTCNFNNCSYVYLNPNRHCLKYMLSFHCFGLLRPCPWVLFGQSRNANLFSSEINLSQKMRLWPKPACSPSPSPSGACAAATDPSPPPLIFCTYRIYQKICLYI